MTKEQIRELLAIEDRLFVLSLEIEGPEYSEPNSVGASWFILHTLLREETRAARHAARQCETNSVDSPAG